MPVNGWPGQPKPGPGIGVAAGATAGNVESMGRPASSAPAIAVDLDDTLNDFTATLRAIDFARDPASVVPPPVFAEYLDRIRRDAPDRDDLLSTEYSYLRYQVHHRCYEQTRPRPDGVAFLRELRARGWRIVICTYRDLRRAEACTRAWLGAHGIPFDHLFMAGNKIVFCRLWGIAHLVDDDPFNIRHGAAHGVRVYFPRQEKHRNLDPAGARGFDDFAELIPWIQG